jgi:hypothetical protein
VPSQEVAGLTAGPYPAHSVTALAALRHFHVSEEKGLTAEEASRR